MHTNRLNSFPHSYVPANSLPKKSKSCISDSETSIATQSTPIYSESHDSFNLPQSNLDNRVNSALNFLRGIGRTQALPPSKHLKFNDYDIYYKGRLREKYVRIQAIDCRDDKRPTGLSIETDRNMDIDQSSELDKDWPWTPTRDSIRSNEGFCANQDSKAGIYNKAPYCKLPTTPEIANQLREKKFLFNVDEFNPERQNLLDFDTKKPFTTLQNESFSTLLNPVPQQNSFQNTFKISEAKTFNTSAESVLFSSPTITPFSPPPSSLLASSTAHNATLSMFNTTFSAGKTNNDVKILGNQVNGDSVFAAPKVNGDSIFGTPKMNVDSMFGTSKGNGDSVFVAPKVNGDTMFGVAKVTVDSVLSAPKFNAGSIFSPPKGTADSVLPAPKLIADSVLPTPKLIADSVLPTPKLITDSAFFAPKMTTDSEFPAFRQNPNSAFLTLKSTPDSISSVPEPNILTISAQPSSISSGVSVMKVPQPQPPVPSPSKESKEPKKQFSSFFVDNPIDVPFDDPGFNDSESAGEANSEPSTPKTASKTPTFASSGANSENKQKVFNFQENSSSSNLNSNLQSGNLQDKPLFGLASKESQEQNKPKSLFDSGNKDFSITPSLFSEFKSQETPVFGQAPQPSLFSAFKSQETPAFGQAPQTSAFGQVPQGSLFGNKSINPSFSLGLPGANLFASSTPNLLSTTKTENIEKPTYENMFSSQTSAKSLLTPPSISFSSLQSSKSFLNPSTQFISQPAVTSQSSKPSLAVSSFFMSQPQQIPIEEGFAEDAYEKEGFEIGSSEEI